MNKIEPIVHNGQRVLTTLQYKLQLLNICCFYSQLEERATADCMPKIAAHAYKQYCRYKMRLNARRVANAR